MGGNPYTKPNEDRGTKDVSTFQELAVITMRREKETDVWITPIGYEIVKRYTIVIPGIEFPREIVTIRGDLEKMKGPLIGRTFRRFEPDKGTCFDFRENMRGMGMRGYLKKNGDFCEIAGGEDDGS